MVSAAQYITELICENKAKQDRSDLHYRFWLNKEWAGYYRNQIASSRKLLTKYEPKAIILALTSKAASRIYSLRAPHLPAIIEKEQAKLNSQNTEISKPIDRTIDSSLFRQTVNKQSIISRLKDIDNEH